MGRRSSQVARYANPEQTRREIQRHVLRLSTHSFNLARVRAQSHEEEMIDVLYGLATDPAIAPTLRRQCAIDVLEQARGRIAMQLHDGATIDPAAQAADGTDRTVGEQIEAARLAASEMTAIQEWASVPFEQWPEHVRALLGPGMEAAFVEVHAETTVPGDD